MFQYSTKRFAEDECWSEVIEAGNEAGKTASPLHDGPQDLARSFVAKLVVGILFVAFFFLAQIGIAQVDEKATDLRTVIFGEMQTQLQRRTRGQEPGGRHFFLAVNLSEIVNQLKEDTGSVALLKLSKEIDRLELSGNEKLYVETLHYEDPLMSDEDRKLATNELQKIESRFDFGGRRDGMLKDADSWKRQSSWYSGTDESAKEVVIGDESTLVFSVNTKLGKYLCRSSSCYIELLEDVDEADGFLDAKTRASINAAFEDLELVREGQVMFEFRGIAGSDGWNKKIKKELLEFVKPFGFDSVDYGYYLDAVDRNESLGLVGKRAPGFELTEFETKKTVKFSELLGSPLTILTFWGNT